MLYHGAQRGKLPPKNWWKVDPNFGHSAATLNRAGRSWDWCHLSAYRELLSLSGRIGLLFISHDLVELSHIRFYTYTYSEVDKLGRFKKRYKKLNPKILHPIIYITQRFISY